MNRLFLFLLSFVFYTQLISCKRWAFPGEGVYSDVVIKQENIPDFSFAGYERSEAPIPLVPVAIELNPEPGDDRQRIQEAINQVSSLPDVGGFRGTVLLKSGLYEVSGPLKISASGVVLRGEGQGEDGTIMLATGKYQHTLLTIEGSEESLEWGETRIKDLSLSFGTTRLTVDEPDSFQPGDTIVVVKTPNDDWIKTLGTDKYGWTTEEYTIAHRRIVKRIDNDSLFIDMPLVDAIEQRYGGGYVAKASFPNRVSRSGIECMRLKSVYDHDRDEKHAWIGVTLDHATNCWIRNLTAMYFGYSCVSIYGRSDFNTIQDCAMLDPKSITGHMRKYSFNLGNDSGIGNLFIRCYARGGRHDFVTGARVNGPNVFLDCVSVNAFTSSGPHHRWATGTLYDNIKTEWMEVRNRHDRGTGHGWAGAQNMVWNVQADRFHIESPPDAVNWCVGCSGNPILSTGYILSWGVSVRPRRLFIEQLQRRSNSIGVDLIPEQMSNTDIWNMLEMWAGDGNPLSGIR